MPSKFTFGDRLLSPFRNRKRSDSAKRDSPGDGTFNNTGADRAGPLRNKQPPSAAAHIETATTPVTDHDKQVPSESDGSSFLKAHHFVINSNHYFDPYMLKHSHGLVVAPAFSDTHDAPGPIVDNLGSPAGFNTPSSEQEAAPQEMEPGDESDPKLEESSQNDRPPMIIQIRSGQTLYPNVDDLSEHTLVPSIKRVMDGEDILLPASHTTALLTSLMHKVAVTKNLCRFMCSLSGHEAQLMLDALQCVSQPITLWHISTVLIPTAYDRFSIIMIWPTSLQSGAKETFSKHSNA